MFYILHESGLIIDSYSLFYFILFYLYMSSIEAEKRKRLLNDDVDEISVPDCFFIPKHSDTVSCGIRPDLFLYW